MKRDQIMSLEEHLVNANDFAMVRHYLTRIYFRCREYYPETSRLMASLNEVFPNKVNGIFSQIKAELEGEYQKIISDEEFDQYGKIYYNLEKRYEKLKDDFTNK